MASVQPTAQHFVVNAHLTGEHDPSLNMPETSNNGITVKVRKTIRDALLKCQTGEDLIAAIAESIAAVQPCIAIWIDSPRGNSNAFEKLQLPSRLEEIKTEISNVANRQCQRARKLSESAHLENTTSLPFRLSCVPIDRDEDSADVICFLYNKAVAKPHVWSEIVHQVADQVTIWKKDRINQTVYAQTKQIADAFNLSQSICAANSPASAARAIVNQLRLILNADFAAIALNPLVGSSSLGDLNLTAISDVELIDKTSDIARFAELSCREAAQFEEPNVYSNGSAESRQPMPLNQLAKSIPSNSAIGLALKCSSGKVVGSIVVTFADSNEANQQAASLRRVAPVVADQLHRTIEATQNPLQKVAYFIKQSVSTYKARLAIGLFALAVTIMCIPMPYTVNCHCKIQPVIRRIVPAPFEGILAKCNVKPGDVVKANQVLASMEGQQLIMEQAALQAELAREIKKRDSALAANDVAKSQIASHEIDRLKSQMSRLENRLANLNIRSPIDGIVVSGDLAKVEGAPLEIGQNLFEIAPLETMLVEVEIPESEIRFVKQNMIVDLKLEAFPNKSWNAKIERIYPSAEIIDNHSVFIAEVQLENELSMLRPGMKGNAGVNAHWSPLGWNLFHHWWDGVRRWTTW